MKDPMKPILFATLIMITILLFMNYAIGEEKTKSHMSSAIGASAGYGTCRAMLDTNITFGCLYSNRCNGRFKYVL